MCQPQGSLCRTVRQLFQDIWGQWNPRIEGVHLASRAGHHGGEVFAPALNRARLAFGAAGAKARQGDLVDRRPIPQYSIPKARIRSGS